MRVIKLLVLIQGLSLLFLIFPFNGIGGLIIQPFPFHTILIGDMYVQTYMSIVCEEHIIPMIFYYIFWKLIDHKYKYAIVLFGYMQFVFFIEFLLNYNQPWLSIYGLGIIGMTHIFIIFKLMILFMMWKQEN